MLVIIFLGLVVIAIPTIALAKSHLKEKPKQQPKIVTEIRTEKEPLKEPEFIKPIPEPTPVIKTPPTPVVGPTGTCSEWMTQAGITDLGNAIILINRESSCNPNSVNKSSGACGIGHQLPCGKWPHTWNDPVGGMIDMQNYVIGRYGSWAGAVGFSNTHGWY